MTPTRKRRLIALLLILAGVGVASTVAFYSLQENLLYFQSPSDLAMQPIPPGRQFRLGGLVKPGSVTRTGGGLGTRFVVTDGPKEVEVEYDGPEMTIGFNVGYLLDVLGVLDGDQVQMAVIDSNSSSLVTQKDATDCRYVVMPMRL